MTPPPILIAISCRLQLAVRFMLLAWIAMLSPDVLRAQQLKPAMEALRLGEFSSASDQESNWDQLGRRSSVSSDESRSGDLESPAPDSPLLTVAESNRRWYEDEPRSNQEIEKLSAQVETESFEQKVGYDDGFVIASRDASHLDIGDFQYRLQINGWGQLRLTNFISDGAGRDLNQFQLKRARLNFSGHAFTPDFSYFISLDGRSASNDTVRLLDYFLSYDVGHHVWNWDKSVLVAKVGQYKIPFTLARAISGKEFQFTDRSVASMYFDANRSLAVGLYGERCINGCETTWETAIFNGLITGGAETGSTGTLDNNFAVSARVAAFPVGKWGADDLCDWEFHCQPAVRIGAAFASSTLDRAGTTEFNAMRVVDSGGTLAAILPGTVSQFLVNCYSVDYSHKCRGWSFVAEYYFRNIGAFEGAAVPQLFDHGFWLQTGYFIVPKKLEAIARWSRVVGNSGTLGAFDLSSDERASGFVWYFRHQSAKFTVDATYLDGSPVDSFALDITPGSRGWLFRSQIQFSF